MKYPCEIIQDLIPLVNDNIANPVSKNLVCQHISECEMCRNYKETTIRKMTVPDSTYEQVAPDVISKAQSYSEKVKCRYKKLILIAIAVTAIIVLTCTVFMSVLVANLTIFAKKYTTNDIIEYGNYNGHIEQEEISLYERTSLALFPSNLKNAKMVNGYYYYCSQGGFDNSYQIILDYSLSKSDYEAEAMRISKLSQGQFGLVNSIIYDNNSFPYPAYVATFQRTDDRAFGNFEYVLMDDMNYRIISVLVISSSLDHLPLEDSLKPPDELIFHEDDFSIYPYPISVK